MNRADGDVLSVAYYEPWPSWELGEAHRLIENFIRVVAQAEMARRK